MFKISQFLSKKDKWLEIFLLAIIIFLGLLLRISPAFNWEIRCDEAFTFFTREQSFLGLIWFDPPHPPLFYWLIKIWSQIRTDVFFLRIPSLFLSCFNFILIYLIAKEIKFNKYFPILTVLFFSFSYLNIGQSFQIRMYVLALFLMLLSFLSYLKILFSDKKTKLFLIIFCLANFFGILTDYSFIWYYLVLISGTLILLFLKRNQFSKKQLFFLKYGFGISSALMVLWLPVFAINFQPAMRFFYKPESLFGELKGFFLDTWVNSSLSEFIIFLILLITVCVSGFLLLRLSLLARKLKESLFWLTTNLFFYITVLAMIIIFFIFDHTVIPAKHVLVGSLFPIFALAGIVSFLLSKSKFYWKVLSLIILISVITIDIITIKNSPFYIDGMPSYKEAAEFYKKNANLNTDNLVVIPENNDVVFKYYFFNYDSLNKKDKIVPKGYKSQSYASFLKGRGKGTYWFVNLIYEDFNKYFQEKEKFFLNKCLETGEVIYYKKAYFLKCLAD